MKHHHPPNQSHGYSMIEVLVAIIVLSIGLLGLAGLQLSSLRNNNSAYSRAQAVILSYDIIDRIRANRVGFNTGAYDDQSVGCINPYHCSATNLSGRIINARPSPDCLTNSCTPGQLAAVDLFTWQSKLMEALPNAIGRIYCTADVTAGGSDDANQRALSKHPGLTCGVDGQYLATVTWVEVDRDVSGSGTLEGTKQHTVATGFRP